METKSRYRSIGTITFHTKEGVAYDPWLLQLIVRGAYTYHPWRVREIGPDCIERFVPTESLFGFRGGEAAVSTCPRACPVTLCPKDCLLTQTQIDAYREHISLVAGKVWEVKLDYITAVAWDVQFDDRGVIDHAAAYARSREEKFVRTLNNAPRDDHRHL